MIEKTPQLAPTANLTAYGAARQVRNTEQTAAKFRLLQGSSGFPETPPPDVLSSLDSAARLHDELHQRGLNVSFDVQPDGGVRVSVLDETGKVVKNFSPAQGLDALSGELPVDDLDA
ncbi:MAG TPA: hypothetical protein VG652_09735 [Gaiellaceae bacterium]|nr:hypothetical protein [Gaiellaceae bacterium]